MKKIEIIDGRVWCEGCSKHKNVDEFYSFKGQIKRPCKVCKGIYQKQFYEENKDDIEEYRKIYYQENRLELIADQLARDSNRKEQIAIVQKIYRQVNKTELLIKKKAYRKNRIKNDPSLKLRGYVSNAIFQGLKYTGGSKGGKSILQYLEYTIDDLRIYIESLFEPWMTWENWGTFNSKTWNDSDFSTWTWHIDHIIPQAKLPYHSMEDNNFKKCWELSNLRPYSAKQNVIDGANRII